MATETGYFASLIRMADQQRLWDASRQQEFVKVKESYNGNLGCEEKEDMQ